MKKAFSLILAFLFAAALTGCGSDSALEERVAALEQQVIHLQEQITALEANRSDIAIENIGSVAVTGGVGSAELRLNNWYAEDGVLTVDLFIRIDSEGETQTPDAHLLLHLGSAQQEQQVVVYPGEAEGSFEAETGEITFDLSGLAADEELELELVVTFADGQELRTGGIGWYQEDGVLYQVAG